MKKFILISPKNRTTYNFRGDLIREIAARGYEVVVTGPNRDNIGRIEELGVRFVEIPMNKNGINPFADIRYTWQLYKLMRRERIDVSLGYTIKPVIYGSLAARFAGVKCRNAMITGAGYLFISKGLKTALLRFISFILYRIGLGCATNVIFQNNDDREEFVSNRLCRAAKCHVVNGSGVNMQKYPPAPYPDATTFFMLSRLLYSKGVIEFLRAAEIVKSKYPQVRFMLLGKVETAMQDAIRSGEVEHYVSTGIVEHFPETDNVAAYYARCSVYVLPSYREGTPRSVLEAMSMGRPIITCDCPGCRETVVDGYNGFLVPVGKAEAVADAMEHFITHPELIDVMGKKSLTLCREKFEVGRVNKSMIDIMALGRDA